MSDPEQAHLATARLAELAGALDVIDEHAELNHRYRKLIDISRQALGNEYVRLSQARGIAKRIMVLVRASGAGFAESLPEAERTRLDAGLTRANVLVFDSDPDAAGTN